MLKAARSSSILLDYTVVGGAGSCNLTSGGKRRHTYLCSRHMINLQSRFLTNHDKQR